MVGTYWIWTAAIVALFCTVRAVFDLHQKRYGWGIAGIVCATALLMTPVETHAVKIDLPILGGPLH